MKLLDGVDADATLSPCGNYRYLLSREWHPRPSGRRLVTWVMLNPSTADHDVDDATIRKCQTFARSWGYTGIRVVNLFALRSTDPKALYKHPDPIGPDNDDAIRSAATAAETALVVTAWGAHGSYRSRGLIVTDRLRAAGVTPMRLGPATKGGHPGHPLYLADDIELEESTL